MEFTNYSEKLLTLQHNFVSKLTSNWPNWHYPTIEELKCKYSSNLFSHDTQHYAINNKIVGFISSTVEDANKGLGSIQIPFIEENKPEVESELMYRAEQVLEEKGVRKIQITLFDNWNPSFDPVKYGYSEKIIIRRLANVNFKDYIIMYRGLNCRELSFSEDLIQLTNAFSIYYNCSKEEANFLIKGFVNNPNIMNNSVLIQGNKIIGHSISYLIPETNEIELHGLIFFNDITEKQFNNLLDYSIERIQNRIIKGTVRIILPELNLKEEVHYRKRGIEFSNQIKYVKYLNTGLSFIPELYEYYFDEWRIR